MVGQTFGALPGHTSAGRSDAFIRKYTSNGDELGTRQFGTEELDTAFRIELDVHDNLFVVSSIARAPSASSFLKSDSSVRKYDGDGNELWTRRFGTRTGDEVRDQVEDMTVDGAGNLYVVGLIQDPLFGPSAQGTVPTSDALVRKYDSDGNELWTRQFGTRNLDSALSVVLDDAGSLNIVGWTEGALPDHANSGGSDAFVVKMSDVHGDN